MHDGNGVSLRAELQWNCGIGTHLVCLVTTNSIFRRRTVNVYLSC